MNIFGIILLVLCGGLVTWLLIDTIVAIVKRVKQRKLKKDKVD